ncbi:peptidoglycan -binding protein [Marinimicrococcus flavescens]|uniref:Peptidoglycan -binding protein n=1 Tax=Marinimicrococcus flavescens TaxID=3031815 RepID=A0AAP3XSK6_9PROT|nr:peptidoglycan -binding protein [Marinimicrococcus flavescens]
MARSRRETRHVDIWPGFVDALSTLLLSIIFLLVVFVLGQFFMGQMLQGRDEAMTRLERMVHDLRQQLQLEQDSNAELKRSVGRLSTDLQGAMADRDELRTRLSDSEASRAELDDRLQQATGQRLSLERTLEEMRLSQGDLERQAAATREELEAARQSMAADKEAIELQLAELVQLRRDIEALREVRTDLESQVAALGSQLQTTEEERKALLDQLGQARDQGRSLEAELEQSREKTMLVQREVEEKALRIEELVASSAELEQARSGEAEARSEAEARLEELRRQLTLLTGQLTRLESVLGDKQDEIARQNTTIAELGRRLNLALATKVEELTQYRSEFFGKVRTLLGERENVRVVGDRFVFQSEVLFASGEAEIGPGGRERLAKLAAAFKEIIAEIPDELPWVLQVDGHTDRRPISTPRFPSNWELSTARAISVAEFLISQGIPPDRVAARGFAQFQPLDDGDTEEAFRRNRRIEIKLTTR